MRNIKLIALDLDGTLLGPDKLLSAENAAALERAAREGIEIVPATGRFYRGMPQIIRDLPYVRYVITINGAQVFDVARQQTVCGSEIPWQRAVSVMERLDGLPVIYDCFQNGWGWMTQRLYDQVERYTENGHTLDMLRQLRTPVPELKAFLKERAAGVQKIQMFFQDMELRAAMLRSLPEEFPDLVVSTAIVNNIEINSREATKGVALEKLAAHLGVPAAQTMAFGDDLNDIPMLRAAGIGVAMKNAAEEVKRAADYVTDSCDDSGVAHAMRHFLWENEL